VSCACPPVGLLAGTLQGRSPSSLFLFVPIFVGAFGGLALLRTPWRPAPHRRHRL